MPIFRFLSLENETPSLVFETQKLLVFLGLKLSEKYHFLEVPVAFREAMCAKL